MKFSTAVTGTPLQMVREFHKAMGLKIDQEHPLKSDLEEHEPANLEALRWSLVKEEFEEFRDSMDLENMLKEAADLVYVGYGYAATYGWDLDEALRRVHASNMSKLDDEGKPILNEVGKVIKGPNYKPPYLGDLV
tara:strand:+ start:1645 stop:2049 length:405 start_codon:yes stop_codon:yes gene_type:complete